eukprot:TRINITY_DN6879_c0_g1_i1.p3 TRINITY_DN6879_c0_g1~~TRINITY_DN6879_c0_g1_i1.p3  ORF type:complete len:118 (-),score=29.02 TRINITY_DN6879_c0_g1_i1:457-810(-)
MIRRPPRSTHCISSAASDVYKRQYQRRVHGTVKPREKKEYIDNISYTTNYDSSQAPQRWNVSNKKSKEKEQYIMLIFYMKEIFNLNIIRFSYFYTKQRDINYRCKYQCLSPYNKPGQ